MILVYLTCVLTLLNYNVSCEGKRTVSSSNNREEPPKAFIFVKKDLSTCSNRLAGVMSVTLRNLPHCFISRWQQCLHVHLHEMTSPQMELEIKFFCQLRHFDVSNLQTLTYRIQVPASFQVRLYTLII